VINYDYEVAVDPENLLRVRYQDPLHLNDATIVALTCAYVPAIGRGGQRQVAVELVFDPAEQNPANAYYCDPQRLQQVLIPPGSLRGIKPYLT
jgi:hypothetical protein